MAGFLARAELPDMYTLGGLGGAVKGFAQGMMDVENRRYKRMEMDAKMNSEKADAERKSFQSKLDAYKENVIIGPDGGLMFKGGIDPVQKSKLATDIQGKGLLSTIDENGVPQPNGPNSQSPQMIGAKNKGVSLNGRDSNMAQRMINNDRVLNTFIPRAEGAAKILKLMDAAEGGDVKSNKTLLGLLNAEIARLETGSQNPGLNQSEKTEMESSLASFYAIKDKLFNTVSGVDLKDQFRQARAMVNDLGSSYVDSIRSRGQFLSAGASPDQQAVYQAKMKSLEDIYGSAFTRGAGHQKKGQQQAGLPKTQSASPTQKPKVVIQNGYTYTLDPNTGEYK